MQRLAIMFMLAAALVLVGCNGAGEGAGTRVAEGAYTAGDGTLGFELPSEYVYIPIGSRQTGSDEILLAEASLTGLAGPEVREGETTRVPLTFDLTGMGDIDVTAWRVEIRNQVSGASQDQRKSIDPVTRKAVILFTSLPTGRYDATVDMYGTVQNAGGSGAGSLLFELEIQRDE